MKYRGIYKCSNISPKTANPSPVLYILLKGKTLLLAPSSLWLGPLSYHLISWLYNQETKWFQSFFQYLLLDFLCELKSIFAIWSLSIDLVARNLFSFWQIEITNSVFWYLYSLIFNHCNIFHIYPNMCWQPQRFGGDLFWVSGAGSHGRLGYFRSSIKSVLW